MSWAPQVITDSGHWAVALDETGRPQFNDLLFGRRLPSYIPFDVLMVDGEDVSHLPLKQRKSILDEIACRYRLEKTEPFFAEGRALFNAVCRLDLEGIVAKRLEDPYVPSPHQHVATSGTAAIGGPFTLVTTDGKSVSDETYRGKWLADSPRLLTWRQKLIEGLRKAGLPE